MSSRTKMRLDKPVLWLGTLAGVVGLYGIAWVLYSLVGPNEQFLPHPENVLMLLVTIILTLNIKNRYARNLFIFWSAWFVIGAVSLFAMNQLTWGLNYNVDSREANRFFLLCVVCAVLGALLQQFLTRYNQESVVPATRGRNLLIYIFLFVFPFLYAGSVILATGTIPILSGIDISAAMYEVDYGPLHSFGVFVPVAAVLLWLELNRSGGLARGNTVGTVVLCFLALFLLFGSIDGRRAFTLIALMAMMLAYLERPLDPKRLLGAAAMAAGALLLYVIAAELRSGGSGAHRSGTPYASLAAIGVEYRDYVWGFVNLRPEAVRGAGYDWFGSTAASATPGFLMKLLDIDKQALVVRDSARVLMGFFNVKLGIRVGLPGELWFAVQWLALPVFFIFGIVIQLLASRISRTDHYVYKAILLTGLSLCAFSIMGQSTVTFGLILPLAYLALLTWFVQRLVNINLAPPRRTRRKHASGYPYSNAYR